MSDASQKNQQGQQSQQTQDQVNGTSVDLPMIRQHEWTALGVLAEVSRQINQHEKSDDIQPASSSLLAHVNSSPSAALAVDRLEAHHQLVVEGPDNHVFSDVKDHDPEKTEDERIGELLQADNSSIDNANTEPTNLTVAAAATARMHPGLLDPQLLGADAAAAAEAATATVAATDAAAAAAAAAAAVAAVEAPADVVASAVNSLPQSPIDQSQFIPTTIPTPLPTGASQPWGEITYTTESYQASPVAEATMIQNAGSMVRGGFHLGRLEANSAKSRHSRQRFTPERREQVKDVRKIGACIRCRILRKTCSKGEPCDTCRRVLSPRIWRSGCIRTKFNEQLDLYSASVQIVLAQSRINSMKQNMTLSNSPCIVELSHFDGQEARMQVTALQQETSIQDEIKSDADLSGNSVAQHSIAMLDSEGQDLPARIENYMRANLQELIAREPSHFSKVTLQTAYDIATAHNDELLRKALELWGYVEMLDREQQWVIGVIVDKDTQTISHYIKEDTDKDTFTTICLQLGAAIERKTATTSKALLAGMQRVLQDSKVKIDFNMYLTTILLLHCVEKTTWGFKAWEQENLKPSWPLSKEPGSFAGQGAVIANLLRMLLEIRKAQPRLKCSETDGKLVTEEEDPVIKGYFEAIDLDYAYVKDKQENTEFSPTDTRSLELLFCSTLLLSHSD
ncbi:hypothetical protein OQA88_12920 [Cercophora sp. LCS_1]